MEYQIARYLGLAAALIIIMMSMLFVIRRVKKHFFKDSKILEKISLILGKVHPKAGYFVLAVALVHGFLMTGGRVTLNSGTILFLLLIIMMLLSIIGKKVKWKKWLIVHRIVDIAVLAVLVIHLKDGLF